MNVRRYIPIDEDPQYRLEQRLDKIIELLTPVAENRDLLVEIRDIIAGLSGSIGA